MAAVAGPLPALLPGSMTGAWSYSPRRQGRLVGRQAHGGRAFPAAIVGAIASQWVSGPVLAASPAPSSFSSGCGAPAPSTPTPPDPSGPRPRRPARRLATSSASRRACSPTVAASLLAAVLLAVGLDMNRATGTSLVVAPALTIPTLITHAAIGHRLGRVTGVRPRPHPRCLGRRPRDRSDSGTDKLRGASGFLLVGFAVWFLVREVRAPGLTSAAVLKAAFGSAPVGSVRN